MGRYQTYWMPSTPDSKGKKIHPIWRGIGCVLMVLLPVISYAASIIIVEENIKNHWVEIPYFLRTPILGDPNALVKVMLTLVMTMLLFSLITFLTVIIFRMFGRPRRGPYDVMHVDRHR